MSDETATRKVLTGSQEIRDAAIRVARSTKRHLAIYSHELNATIYDSPAFLSAITELALATRAAQVRVLLGRSRAALSNAPKFIELSRRMQSVVHMRQLGEEAGHHEETFLVADEHGIIYQPSEARWEGISDTEAPHLARRYLTTFNDMWERSAPDPEFRRLSI